MGAITEMVRHRINTYDANFNMGFFGMPGDGKSIACVVAGVKIDPTFSIQEDILYDKSDFFERADYLMDEHLAKGKFLMLDEAGVGVADAMEYWDKQVKEVVRQMRTNRYANMCCGLVSPMFKDIVAKARGLFNGYFIPKKTYQREGNLRIRTNIDRVHKVSYWKFYTSEVDPISGDMYKYFVRGLDGGKIKVVEFKLPPKQMVLDYKKKSVQFKDSLRRRGRDRLRREALKHSTRDEIIRMAKEALPLVRQDKKIWLSNQGRIKTDKICNTFGVGDTIARRVRTAYETILYEKARTKREKEQKLKQLEAGG